MQTEGTPETEAQGFTEQQAVAELFARYEAKKEPAKKEAADSSEEAPVETEAEQPEGDVQAEAETEDAPEDEGEIEIDVAGEKFNFSKKNPVSEELIRRVAAKAKEVEAGSTRRFQEAADLRKAADTQRQSVDQMLRIAQAQADVLADHAMVSRRLQAIEQININELDSESLHRLTLEAHQLNAAKTRIEGKFHQNLQNMQEEDNKAFQAKREHLEKTVAARVKGWSPDHWTKLAEYAVSKGVPPPNLQGITEPWMVEILDDAAYGHAMRQAKPQQLKRVATVSQTLKPGASGTQKSAANLKIASADAKFKKTGKVDDAASLLWAKMQSKGGRKP